MSQTTVLPAIQDSKYGLITSKIKSFVLERDPEAEVYLFGSRARGTAGPESDWDFFIATSKEDRSILEDQLLDPVVDILLEHEELVQYITFSKERWESGASPSPVYDSIRSEGVRI